MPRHKICTVLDLPPLGARGFSLAEPGPGTDIFIVCRDGQAHAYLNRCPHTGVNLDWKPDAFMDYSGELIQCSTHGALFRVEDGFCIQGPCAGQSLSPIALDEEDGVLFAVLPEPRRP